MPPIRRSSICCSRGCAATTRATPPISNAYPAVAKKLKEGQADSVVEWFEDAYSYREFDAKAFVALIVDKLES
jgi:hypothetical protein